MPSRRSVPLVQTFSSTNIGLKTTTITFRMYSAGTAKAIGFCMAMRLGTISPNAMEKNEMMTVTTTVEITEATPAGIGRASVSSMKESR